LKGLALDKNEFSRNIKTNRGLFALWIFAPGSVFGVKNGTRSFKTIAVFTDINPDEIKDKRHTNFF